MIRFLETSLVETKYTKKIQSLEMPQNTSLVTFFSDKPSLPMDDVQKEVMKSLKDKKLISLMDLKSRKKITMNV